MTTANTDANARKNTVTAPAVTKIPVPVPLRRFRTVLLTTRACGRRLELDGKEGVKVRSVRLPNKEKGMSISGFDVPPRSTVDPTAEVKTVGGGREEGGNVKTNEENEAEEEHEDDGDYEAESSLTRRGVKGKEQGQWRG